MSTANIQALLDKASTDAALQQKLEALKDAPLDDILHLASAEGLPFTQEDWQAYLAKSGDLSDAALSGVAGGIAMYRAMHFNFSQNPKDQPTSAPDSQP